MIGGKAQCAPHLAYGPAAGSAARQAPLPCKKAGTGPEWGLVPDLDAVGTGLQSDWA